MDQQAALRWVQRNIAGSAATPTTSPSRAVGRRPVGLVHLVSPGSRGLFQRAIVQSGAFALTQQSLAAAEAFGQTFAASRGLRGSERGVPPHGAGLGPRDEFRPNGAPRSPASSTARCSTSRSGRRWPPGGSPACRSSTASTTMRNASSSPSSAWLSRAGSSWPVPAVTACGPRARDRRRVGVARAGRGDRGPYRSLPTRRRSWPSSTLVSDACRPARRSRWTTGWPRACRPTPISSTTTTRLGPWPRARAAHCDALVRAEYLFDLPNRPFRGSLSPGQEMLAASMRTAWANFAATAIRRRQQRPGRRSTTARRCCRSSCCSPQIDSAFASRHHCSFWAAG